MIQAVYRRLQQRQWKVRWSDDKRVKAAGLWGRGRENEWPRNGSGELGRHQLHLSVPVHKR